MFSLLENTTSEIINNELTSTDRLADQTMDLGTGALYAVISILMVFAILLIIIGVTTLVFKITGLWSIKKELETKKKEQLSIKDPIQEEIKPIEITDEDMMAAVLVASIDYQNEINKDVRLVSVKEIK
ncbi:MAG: OadG family transporter subunit [Bacillales bacterium]|nr:OadG family transporter subunit [Bacillales bacterium]